MAKVGWASVVSSGKVTPYAGDASWRRIKSIPAVMLPHCGIDSMPLRVRLFGPRAEEAAVGVGSLVAPAELEDAVVLPVEVEEVVRLEGLVG